MKDAEEGWNLSAHLMLHAAAPYSGQQQFSNARTLPDGTHTSSQSSGVAIYRDAKGRMRTEHHAYGSAVPGRPMSPDDFIVAHITDPVAGFQYVLDPVSRIAHRMAFQSNGTWKWDPSQITNMQSPILPGPNASNQFLGTQTMSGVTAYGYQSTATWAPRGVGSITRTDEGWYAPATGVCLLNKQMSSGRSDFSTVTMANYSEAAPDPSLFQVPNGYQIVDETGSFQVVHARPARGGGLIGIHGPQVTGSCEEGACTISFDPGNGQGNMPSVTGAPYSRTETTSVLNPATSKVHIGPGRASYRDSSGRLRTDPAPVNGRMVTLSQPLVQIDDPVAGFLYILNPATQTAYRIKIAYRQNTFQPFAPQAAGTFTTPRGAVVTVENLGPETISGVSATGERTTTNNPPGTYMNNDKTVVQVNERWLDPKTNIVILTKNSSPESNITASVPDYKEGDPDPALFQIPASHTIIDESGAFSFTAPARQ